MSDTSVSEDKRKRELAGWWQAFGDGGRQG